MAERILTKNSFRRLTKVAANTWYLTIEDSSFLETFGNSFIGRGFYNIYGMYNFASRLMGRVPQSGNRMLLNSNTGLTQVQPTIDTTYGTMIWSWMPMLGLSPYKIQTILPYKGSTTTADCKVRIMFYKCYDITQFASLNAYYGTYVPNNFFQNGYPSINSYTNKLSASVAYSGQNAQYSQYFPLPYQLLGYSAVITVPAGQGNQTIGHTQMYDASGNPGFYLTDGNVMMVVEYESTNAAIGTFGRLTSVPVQTVPDALNCSPNWSSISNGYYGAVTNKQWFLNTSSFKTVAEGGMSSYTPPSTITMAELATIFGGNHGGSLIYSTTNAASGLHTMITF
jgi:hypothetical protein